MVRSRAGGPHPGERVMVLRMGTRRCAGPVGVSGLGEGQRTLGPGQGYPGCGHNPQQPGTKAQARVGCRGPSARSRPECGGRRVPEPSYL